MKLIQLEKIHEGKYLTYYEATFINDNNHLKKYEFTSRSKNLTMDSFGKQVPVGVGLIPYNKDKSKILLEREFRLATNHHVYNFPAGLIDAGETPSEAAKRELKEETGVDLIEVIDVLPPSFALPGTSDELMCIVVCTAEGEIQDSIFEDEEIKAKWYSKEEIRKLLNEGAYMSVRTQMFLYMWINE